MEQKKEKVLDKISIRLDEKSAKHLQRIMEARGINRSDAVRFCIQGTQILQIGNCKELAKEFYGIRIALESGNVTDDVRKEVEKLCQYMCDLIRKVEKCEN